MSDATTIPSVKITPAGSISAPAPADPSQDRTGRYMARVAAHLPTLPANQRLTFLRRERAKWIVRSEQFELAVMRGTFDETEGAPTIHDFILPVLALNSAIAKLRRGE